MDKHSIVRAKTELQLKTVILPFLTEYIDHRIDIGSYKYLSIKTDGAINPNSNRNEWLFCQIELSSGLLIPLHSEINNLFVGEISFIKYTNRSTMLPLSPNQIESGYNNLYIVLSNYEMDFKFTRHNPAFCWEGTLVEDEQKNFWIGVDNPVNTWQLLIPYLPIGYSTIAYFYYTNALVSTMKLLKHFDCPIDVINTEALNLTETGQGQITNETSRFKIELLNRDAEPRDFIIQMYWLNKGNSLN